MAKVGFKLDIEKDLWNNWHKSNWKSEWGDFNIPKNVRDICESKEFKDCKKELKEVLSKLHKSPIVEIYLKSVEKAWRLIERDFFSRMDRLMKKKYKKNITAYITTLGICPYDCEEPSFMFSLCYSLPKALQTCGHEIMHLYFHDFYWNKIEKQIGKEKTGDLKEALTVLLNIEFKDLWFEYDFGYEPHKELRRFISKEWEDMREKDIEVLLEKCVKKLAIEQ